MKPHREIRRRTAVMVRVGKRRDEIDEMLVPLIREIWKADIQTMMSCQETEPGIAWIEFDSVDELRKWLNIVADFEGGVDTLYNRINYRLAGTTSVPSWTYQLNLLDCGFSLEDDDRYEGPAEFWISVGVYFPHCDLPILLERMKKHNAARKARSKRALPCPR